MLKGYCTVEKNLSGKGTGHIIKNFPSSLVHGKVL